MSYNDLEHSPPSNAKALSAVSLQHVTIADAFWAPKLALFRTVSVDDVLTKFEQDGAFANFDRVARGQSGGHRGHPWFDGLIYETLRAAADFLATSPDPQLDARLDSYIERIAAAQAIDTSGYLNTYVSLLCPDRRWGANGGDQLYHHEEYNAGCLVEAAVHHYLATHKTTLLELAVRFANYLCDYIGPPPKHNLVPSHSLPEEALLKLYRLLHDNPDLARRISQHVEPANYLDLVHFWIDNRGNHQGRLSFTEYAQDHRRLLEQQEAVGHAVRATLLYTGLTSLARELRAPEYYQTASRLWQDVTQRKLYIHGGVGSINQYEGFSFGYYLPSNGYNETCAGVGLAFWGAQMNQAFGSAAYADVVERALYNTVLSGVSLTGDTYSYQNPLVNHGELHRWNWHSCPCCPPMLLKLYASLGEQIYAHDGQDIYINQYIGGTATIPLHAGNVELVLQTRFPWEGTIVATLHLPESRHFGLHLRLPDWCEEFTVRVDGHVQPPLDVINGYGLLRQLWDDGASVELELAMPVRRVVAHPFVAALRERVAIQRGPVIYCLEGVDNDAAEVLLGPDQQFDWAYEPDLLGGVVSITGLGQDGHEFHAIPYYAWDNRKPACPSQDWMEVWLKQAESESLRHRLEGDDHSGWEHHLYRRLLP